MGHVNDFASFESKSDDAQQVAQIIQRMQNGPQTAADEALDGIVFKKVEELCGDLLENKFIALVLTTIGRTNPSVAGLVAEVFRTLLCDRKDCGGQFSFSRKFDAKFIEFDVPASLCNIANVLLQFEQELSRNHEAGNVKQTRYCFRALESCYRALAMQCIHNNPQSIPHSTRKMAAAYMLLFIRQQSEASTG